MALNNSGTGVRPTLPRSPEFAAAMRRAENAALGRSTDERSPADVMASIEEAVNSETYEKARKGYGLR